MPRSTSIAAVAAAAFTLLACGSQGRSMPTVPANPAPAVTETKAADLRVRLDSLLAEHVLLAGKATGAALDGRAEEFAAYGDLVDRNGAELGDVIGDAYGAGART